ncbi:MAG: Smr/MutS family protein [Bacilli bacterium]
MLTLYNSLPKLDLHGQDRWNAVLMVREFIDDSYKLNNKKITIIHGLGEDIIRKAVHDELKINKKVISFNRDFFNMGCTIVDLK